MIIHNFSIQGKEKGIDRTILYILDPSITGGATKSAITLIQEVQAKGIKPIVCTPYYSEVNRHLESTGIQTIVTGHIEMITSIPKISGIRSFKQVVKLLLRYCFHDFKAIRKICKETNIHKIDLIHTNSARSDIGFFLSMLFGIPHVVHIREFGDIDYGCKPLNPFYIFIYNKWGSKFICVSEAVKRHWTNKGLSNNKSIVVYNGIDATHFSVSSDAEKKHNFLNIVIAGSVIRSKGHHLAIKAISMLDPEIQKNIKLDIIGWIDETYQKELFRLMSDIPLITPVSFLGAIPQIGQALGKYQIGLMCSKAEGFGRVTAEYMFAKLGVIASNTGANPEIIENGENGLLFDYNDSCSLSNAILKYYNDRNLLIECSNNAQKTASSRFTSSKNTEQIYSIYDHFFQKNKKS